MSLVIQTKGESLCYRFIIFQENTINVLKYMISSVETDNVALVLQQKNPLYLFFRDQAVHNMAIQTVGMKTRRCLCTLVKDK